MQFQNPTTNKNRAPQDWLGLSILVSVAIFAALFVFSQVGQFIQDSKRDQASAIQGNTQVNDNANH